MKLRTAVIGLGSMGRNHARHYNDMENVELVAVSDPDPAALSWFSQRYRAACYADYTRMLAQERLDIVSVTVPTILHRDVALAAIGCGVHVIVEKPIAFSAAQGREMIAAAEQAGVKLTVGHVERFNPVVTRMKAEIQQGTLGAVFRLHARRQSPYPYRIRDVGVVIDLAPHDLDVMRYLMDSEIISVHAEVQSRLDSTRADVLASLLRFDNGMFGLLEVDWLTPTTVRELSVSGERGMFIANYLTQELFFFENGRMASDWEASRQFVAISEGEMRKLKIARKEPLRIELEDFAQAVCEDRVPLVTGADALRALVLARAILTSGARGETVAVPAEKAGGRVMRRTAATRAHVADGRQRRLAGKVHRRKAALAEK